MNQQHWLALIFLSMRWNGRRLKYFLGCFFPQRGYSLLKASSGVSFELKLTNPFVSILWTWQVMGSSSCEIPLAIYRSEYYTRCSDTRGIVWQVMFILLECIGLLLPFNRLVLVGMIVLWRWSSFWDPPWTRVKSSWKECDWMLERKCNGHLWARSCKSRC